MAELENSQPGERTSSTHRAFDATIAESHAVFNSETCAASEAYDPGMNERQRAAAKTIAVGVSAGLFALAIAQAQPGCDAGGGEAKKETKPAAEKKTVEPAKAEPEPNAENRDAPTNAAPEEPAPEEPDDPDAKVEPAVNADADTKVEPAADPDEPPPEDPKKKKGKKKAEDPPDAKVFLPATKSGAFIPPKPPPEPQQQQNANEPPS